MVVHGDLKACNVVIGDRGDIAKICDFGSSRINCDCYDGPEDQDGTAQWDSPELFGGSPRSAGSDIWAFGCLILETQFDKTPYDPNYLKARRMQLKKLPPAMEDSVDFENSPVSRYLWAIIQKCWERDPANRPDTMAVLTALETVALLNSPIVVSITKHPEPQNPPAKDVDNTDKCSDLAKSRGSVLHSISTVEYSYLFVFLLMPFALLVSIYLGCTAQV
ncbi:hypothetical protein FRC07_004664 [Ceratobasidium sp. 392]|nr:hypothetical protein FRC07_004664 [Ceratobasidium sp. 392]